MKLSKSSRVDEVRSAPPLAGALQEFMLRKAREAVPVRALPPPFDVLGPALGNEVRKRWTKPCEEMFEFLADKHPDRFLALLTSEKLHPTDLTFAAEIAGNYISPATARPYLLALLNHRDPVVREGAIYGLADDVDQAVGIALRAVSERDLSSGVRTAALAVLSSRP